MAGKTKSYRGWQLIEAANGWFVEKGGTRIRVGYSRNEHDEAMEARMRRAIDEYEGRGSGNQHKVR